MQRYLMALGMVLVFLAAPCFADEALSTLLQQRLRLQSNVTDIDAQIAAFVLENPLTTAAVIAVVGGTLVVIQEQLPQDSRNLAAWSTVAGIAYCWVNSESCKNAIAYMTPLALKKISAEKTLQEVDARIAQLRSSSLPRTGQSRE